MPQKGLINKVVTHFVRFNDYIYIYNDTTNSADKDENQ